MGKRKIDISKFDHTHWSISANLEEQSMKLDRASGILWLIAEHSFHDMEAEASNALWAAVDIVREVREELDRLGSEHMKLHRKINNIAEPNYE